MYGQLQYGDTGAPIVYKYLGTLRPQKGRLFNIEPVMETNREGINEIIAYKVTAEAIAHNLQSDFLDTDEHYFRVIFPDDLKMIQLGGVHKYQYKYDALLTRNNIEYHTVTVEFFITVADIENYNLPVALPESEGGVVIEDDGIYIE